MSLPLSRFATFGEQENVFIEPLVGSKAQHELRLFTTARKQTCPYSLWSEPRLVLLAYSISLLLAFSQVQLNFRTIAFDYVKALCEIIGSVTPYTIDPQCLSRNLKAAEVAKNLDAVIGVVRDTVEETRYQCNP